MDGKAHFLFYALVLILPLSALAGRRLPLRRTLTLALAWAAIFGAALLVVGLLA